MGWAAGSGLGENIWNKVRIYIPEERREEVARFIYDAVCDLDADDWDGTSDLEIDADVDMYCYECGEAFPISQLNENYCKKCKENNETKN